MLNVIRMWDKCGINVGYMGYIKPGTNFIKKLCRLISNTINMNLICGRKHILFFNTFLNIFICINYIKFIFIVLDINRHNFLIKLVPSFIYPIYIPRISHIYLTYIPHLSHIYPTYIVPGLKPQPWRPKSARSA